MPPAEVWFLNSDPWKLNKRADAQHRPAEKSHLEEIQILLPIAWKNHLLPEYQSVYFRAFSGNCLSKICEISVICGYLFMTNEPNILESMTSCIPVFCGTTWHNLASFGTTLASFGSSLASFGTNLASFRRTLGLLWRQKNTKKPHFWAINAEKCFFNCLKFQYLWGSGVCIWYCARWWFAQPRKIR